MGHADAGLTAAGIHVLTFDQRGFGDTSGPADQKKTHDDVESAYAFLISRDGVDKNRIAAGGASCGVMYSSGLASRHPDIKTLLLMSGWADDNARAYFARRRHSRSSAPPPTIRAMPRIFDRL